MIRTNIDLNKLSKIAEITAPVRNKRSWKRNFFSHKYRKTLEKAFIEYADFWVEVIKSVFPHFNINEYLIRVSAIQVSEKAAEIIQKILPPNITYLLYSPVVERSLKDDECLIDESYVLFRRGVKKDDASC